MSRRLRLVALTLVLALVTSACVGDSEESAASGSIVFWTTEDLADRMDVQRDIAAAFTEETGIDVEVTAVAERELPNRMSTNAAAGDAPDVVFHGLEFVAGWAAEGLIDPEAANEVVEELGADTFSAPALQLATVDEHVASVPGDGWGMLLLYRSDLFAEAGLEPPDTFEQILVAADTLHDPANNMSAITLATDPADVLTQQTFEGLALANGCDMVDDSGVVTLGAPECAEAIEFYSTLVNDYSPGGAQTVATMRETYFAGQTAMMISSPFILDEMAGLSDDALPTCPECEEDPAFLATNTGLVGPLSGGGSEPAQYGQISYFGVGADANVEAAQAFIRYLLSDGYVDWLSTAPEGKVPMRLGTAEKPETFVTQWQGLETGVDRKAVLGENFTDEVLNHLQDGVDTPLRWGFTQGAGEQVTQLYETLVVPQTLDEVLQGGLTAQEAAEQLASGVE